MKKNLEHVIERWCRLVRRQMPREILLCTGLPPSAEQQAEMEDRDPTWRERDCLCLSDPEWVVRQCQLAARAVAQIEDDTLPMACPHFHFGESVISGLLGGTLRYVGTASRTCSGAEPLVRDWSDLEQLKLDDDNPVLKQVLGILELTAAHSDHEYLLSYFILMDALNLAVELRGTTQAYIDLYTSPAELRRLLAFGVELNEWFFRHQERIIRPHNERVAGRAWARLTAAWSTAWDSVDAYTLCKPQVYREFGMEYQACLLKRIGGAMMHMHGTAMFDLLPLVAELEGLKGIQVGTDLHNSETFPLLPRLREARALAGDVPLVRLSLTAEEFERGVQDRLLVGNAQYSVPCDTAEQAHRYIEMASRYRSLEY